MGRQIEVARADREASSAASGRGAVTWPAAQLAGRGSPFHSLSPLPSKGDALEIKRYTSKELATPRNLGLLVGVLFIAYALFGYFTDRILIFVGNRRGPQYAHGEQALLAALGYASFAAAAFLSAFGKLFPPSARPREFEFSFRAGLFFIFLIAAIILVGFRTPY